MAEVLFRARLTRDDSSTPWGFRLQGGADYNKPLTLLKVVEESVAAKGGLHASDILVRLAGKSAIGMTHKDAQETIMAAGNALEIIVERAEVTIQSPPSTPKPQKASKKSKGTGTEEDILTEERALAAEDDSGAGLLASTLSAMTKQNIPHPNDEAQTSVAVPESSTDDRVEFVVNPRHKPGAKRSEATPVGISNKLHVLEEKLLTTADESRLTGRGRTDRSPVPGSSPPVSSSLDWTPHYVNREEHSNVTDGEEEANLLQDSCYHQERQMTSVEVTSVSPPDIQDMTLATPHHEYRETLVLSPGESHRMYSGTQPDGHVLPPSHDTQLASNRGAERQTIGPNVSGAQWTAPMTEGGDWTNVPDDDDHQRSIEEDQHVAPSLTFVGRRTAPPVAAMSTSTRSPLISVTPTSPPTGLTVLPVEHLSHPPAPAFASSQPYDLPELSREMSEIQQEVKRLTDYHSPRLDDIQFSTGGPDIVDIPMPAVKEMVEDLNRRLEAIAAQQPQIAQPPTAQELGLSYLNVRNRTVSEEEDPEREIFIDTRPANVALESFKQKYLANSDDPFSNTYQKLYDVTSPVNSPTMHRKTYSPIDRASPNSRNQRRVHFADPPEQSVIEIEGRSRRRKDRRKDRDRQEPASLPLASHEQQAADTSQYSLTWSPSSSTAPTSHAEGPVPYASSSMPGPIMIERPAQKSGGHTYAAYDAMLTHPESATPSNYPTEPTLPGAYASTSPVQSPGQISVSITHKKGDQAAPTRLAFTLPSAQPGQPTHFRYTMSGTAPQQGQARLHQQPQHSDSGLTYSLPPRYEDSMRTMSYGYPHPSHAYDDPRYMEELARAQAGQRTFGQISGQAQFAQPDPLYVDTTAGPMSPQRTSPIYTTQGNPLYGYRASPTETEDAIQSKSFRALEAHYTDGGSRPEEPGGDPNMRVKVLGSPSQVLQPLATGRPFSQPHGPSPTEVQAVIPGPPVGAMPGPPPPGMEMAGAAIGPGLFALFDSSFTDKFLQWQQSPRTHFESETYKLVHEMEDVHKYRDGKH